jgi:hypothetical protein
LKQLRIQSNKIKVVQANLSKISYTVNKRNIRKIFPQEKNTMGSVEWPIEANNTMQDASAEK